MSNLKQLNLKLLALLTFFGGKECFSQQQDRISDHVDLSWRPSSGYNGKDNLGLEIIIKNKSSKQLNLKEWELWFNSMYPALEKKSNQFNLYDHTGNLFSIEFVNGLIAPKDSIVIDYASKYPISNISTAPNGFYIQHKADPKSYFSIDKVSYGSILLSKNDHKVFYENLYEKNARLNKKVDLPAIFPTPHQLKADKQGRVYTLTKFNVYIDPKLSTSIEKLNVGGDILTSNLNSVSQAAKANVRILYKTGVPVEGYNLIVDNKGITIEASEERGAFYAVQSLYSMPMTNAGKGIQVPFVTVQDKPRYGYRGLMIDISRNFRDKETIKKYLDIMASYKLNVFHFHFIDDEGWRIEIPSLPELTTVGATRSPLYADGLSIEPAYGSGGDVTQSQYLSRADFVEILKYAKDRHITVVPEIETPGHARAAIKAMAQRYRHFMQLGNKIEAEKYLLHDENDASVYNSAQNWTDNIMNPALPSVYTFIGKVVDEFVSMYADAGLKLKKVSIGGDEVPNGVWEKSPKIDALMKEKGLASAYEVWPYYISQVNDLLMSKGLETVGWEEIGMVNKGKGMRENPDLPNKQNIQVDVWNNMIGGGQEDLAYRLANAGYKTVLISASNMYFDMMWNTSFDEPGLKWATYADLYHSYSLLPEDFFANIDTYYSGKRLGKDGFKDKVRLTEKGKANLIGVKGGLWAETVHSEAKLDYMIFPRFFALAEKAWSPKRGYESEAMFDVTAFDKDYTSFINKVGGELPKIADKFKFRLPAVGIKQVEGKVLANIEYPGFDIYYTTDGSTPTISSLKYSSDGVAVSNGTITFAVIDKEGRVGPISTFTK